MLSNALQPQQITPWKAIRLQCTLQNARKDDVLNLQRVVVDGEQELRYSFTLDVREMHSSIP